MCTAECQNSVHAVYLFTRVNILFNSSETKTRYRFGMGGGGGVLGEVLYFLRKRKPISVGHLHLPGLLALARRIHSVRSQLRAAVSLEESAPTEGFQSRTKVSRCYNNTALRMFSQLVGEVLFVSRTRNINQTAPSETLFNKLGFLSSPLQAAGARTSANRVISTTYCDLRRIVGGSNTYKVT